MGDEWGLLIARLVEANGGNQSRTARLIGVSPQRVGSWLTGAAPKSEHLRKVARVTNHSLPYLMAVAYGIPLEEMAEGVGVDVLPYDGLIRRPKAREHLADQYRMLAELPPKPVDLEGEAEPT
jgi:transcriptional regulator with XRE-family HTH domain